MDSSDPLRASQIATDLPLTQLPLPTSTKSCYLAAVLDFQQSYYIYAITFTGQRSTWHGRMFVPTSGVNPDMQKTWHDFYNRHPRGPGELRLGGSPEDRHARVNLGNILGETIHDGQKCFVRRIEVLKGTGKYAGEAFVEKRELMPAIQAARKAYAEALLRKWEEQDAVSSIEEVPQQGEQGLRERFSVQFDASPVKGRKAQVEIWDPEGQEMFRGKVSVVRLERKGEDREVMIKCEVGRKGKEEVLLLEGLLVGDIRHGRFWDVGREE